MLFQFTLNHFSMPSSWLPHSFLSKDPYAFLSHFKSKGISVFLTHHKGQASLENNLHPLGSIFFQNLGDAKHEPFMLVKRNIAYSGSLKKKKEMSDMKIKNIGNGNETKQHLLSLPNKSKKNQNQ